MIKKIINKKNIIIVFVISGCLLCSLFIFAVIKEVINSYEEVEFVKNPNLKYASDNKEDLNALYQKSDSTVLDNVKIYGETGSIGGSPDYLKVVVLTSENDTSGVEYVLDKEGKALNSNNIIVNLIENKDDSSTVDSHYLDAYIALPDGSLIALDSNDGGAKIQINIYSGETRIVQENGNARYLVTPQAKDHLFTVQIGDMVADASKGADLYASTEKYEGTMEQLTAQLRKKEIDTKYFENIKTNTMVGVANLKIYAGKVTVGKRESNVKKKINLTNYPFVYKQEDTIESTEIDDNSYLDLSDNHSSKFIKHQAETGKEFDFAPIIYDYVPDINDKMKKYLEYYKEKADERAASIEKDKEYYENYNENNNKNNNNKGGSACKTFKAMSGFTPTGICWCRNDFHISSVGLKELKSQGFDFSVSDFIYCYTFTIENGGTGEYLEGNMLKDCALELGWNGTYSNEGGYSCQN